MVFRSFAEEKGNDELHLAFLIKIMQHFMLHSEFSKLGYDVYNNCVPS